MKPLTLATVKAYFSDPETGERIAALLYAQAEAQTIRAHVDSYAPAVFEAHRERFTIAPGKRSLAVRLEIETIETEDDLSVVDLDSPEVQAYYADLDKANKAHQDALPPEYHDLPEGHCPALVARSNEIKAERELFEHAADYYDFLKYEDGTTRILHGEKRETMLRLLTVAPA